MKIKFGPYSFCQNRAVTFILISLSLQIVLPFFIHVFVPGSIVSLGIQYHIPRAIAPENMVLAFLQWASIFSVLFSFSFKKHPKLINSSFATLYCNPIPFRLRLFLSFLLITASGLIFIFNNSINSYRYDALMQLSLQGSILFYMLPLLSSLSLLFLIFEILFQLTKNISILSSLPRYFLAASCILSVSGINSALSTAILIPLALFPKYFRYSILSFDLLPLKLRTNFTKYFYFLSSWFFSVSLLLSMLFYGFAVKVNSYNQIFSTFSDSYIQSSYFVSRLSPQYITYLHSLSSNQFPDGSTILNNQLDTGIDRITLFSATVLGDSYPRGIPKSTLSFHVPKVIDKVQNKHNRAGTTPGLMASFTLVFGAFSILALPLYIFVVIYIMSPILEAIPFSPSFWSMFVASYILSPVFFADPFSILLFLDDSNVVFGLIVLLSYRIRLLKNS